jgi:hypothetical protein
MPTLRRCLVGWRRPTGMTGDGRGLRQRIRSVRTAPETFFAADRLERS